MGTYTFLILHLLIVDCLPIHRHSYVTTFSVVFKILHPWIHRVTVAVVVICNFFISHFCTQTLWWKWWPVIGLNVKTRAVWATVHGRIFLKLILLLYGSKKKHKDKQLVLLHTLKPGKNYFHFKFSGFNLNPTRFSHLLMLTRTYSLFPSRVTHKNNE